MPDNRFKGLRAAIADDGSEVIFGIKSGNREFTVAVPFNDLADFILGLEVKAGEALAKLNAASGGDRRLMSPLKPRAITKVRGSGAKDVPILTLELNGQLTLDIALPPDRSQELVEYIQELRSQADTPPSKAN